MNLLSTAFAFIFIAIVALASFWLKEEVINEYKNYNGNVFSFLFLN